jgi:hypothetical protein
MLFSGYLVSGPQQNKIPFLNILSLSFLFFVGLVSFLAYGPP